MKIGVISDTHIPERAAHIPDKILQLFSGCGMILHAGDILELPVLDELRAICPQVKAVTGNMDSPGVRAKLADKEIITAEKIRIGLIHGWGPPQKVMDVVAGAFAAENVQAIVFGHSHQALCQKKDGILFFNPGSATDTVYAPFRSVGIITVDGMKIEGEIVKL
jgi:uncharacterized protein